MRCHQGIGGSDAARAAWLQIPLPVDPAAVAPASFEALFAEGVAQVERAIAPRGDAKAFRRIGKLLARRPAPRRIDKRIVSRRPMMLVKRRPGRPTVFGLFAGHEIVART